jgi:hypothetical protein
MPLRDFAQKYLDIIDNYYAMAGKVTEGKFKYIKEVEVIKCLLENIIFWSDIMIENPIDFGNTGNDNHNDTQTKKV